MVYIEAILTNNNVQCPFRVDADNMKELMRKALQIVKDMIAGDDGCAFNVISFKSNTLNKDNFIKLIEIYIIQKTSM